LQYKMRNRSKPMAIKVETREAVPEIEWGAMWMMPMPLAS